MKIGTRRFRGNAISVRPGGSIRRVAISRRVGSREHRCYSYCRRLVAIASAGAVIVLGGCSSGVSHRAAPAPSVACSTSVAAGRLLAGPPPVTVPVSGQPTAVVGTADGRWAFASVSVRNAGEIAVMALTGKAPRLVRTVKLPDSLAAAFGMVITHDGRLLLVAGNTATAVLSVQALEDGGHNPVVGVLTDAGAGEFEVMVSGDDRYVFVTDEDTGGLSVFDLAMALRDGFSAPGVAVGIVPLADGPVGIAMSPGGSNCTSPPWVRPARMGGCGSSMPPAPRTAREEGRSSPMWQPVASRFAWQSPRTEAPYG